MSKRWAICWGSMADNVLRISFHPGETWKDAVLHFSRKLDRQIDEWLKLELDNIQENKPVEEQINDFSFAAFNGDCYFAIEEVPHG